MREVVLLLFVAVIVTVPSFAPSVPSFLSSTKKALCLLPVVFRLPSKPTVSGSLLITGSKYPQIHGSRSFLLSFYFVIDWRTSGFRRRDRRTKPFARRGEGNRRRRWKGNHGQFLAILVVVVTVEFHAPQKFGQRRRQRPRSSTIALLPLGFLGRKDGTLLPGSRISSHCCCCCCCCWREVLLWIRIIGFLITSIVRKGGPGR